MRGGETGTKVDRAVDTAVNYEVSLADVVRRSERRAWFVAFSAIFMALILACGYFLLLPLKERTPFLIMADAYTGTATVARLRGDFSQDSITANEAVNRSNLAHYVRARESYDIVQRNVRDWNIVFTMSAPDIADAYNHATYSTGNPDSLLNTYGSSRAIRVEIISITLLDSTRDTQGPGTGGGDATVRFQRLLVDKSSGASSPLDTRVANIRYNYNKGLKLDEKLRFENPLGFQVISYRVDTELVSIPVHPPGATAVSADIGGQQPPQGAAGALSGQATPGAHAPDTASTQAAPPRVAPMSARTNGVNDR